MRHNEMVTRMVMLPKFKHDCPECVFLGRWSGYDLYIHKGERYSTYIARFGDEGDEYTSNPRPAQQGLRGGFTSTINSPLMVAFAIAYSRGMLSDPEPTMLQFAAKCALADLVGIMPEFEPSGDRTHPAWDTIRELYKALKNEGVSLSDYEIYESLMEEE